MIVSEIQRFPVPLIKVQLVSHQPKLGAEIEERVTELWQSALQQGKIDGDIITFVDFENHLDLPIVSATLSKYRYFWAQYHDSSLGTLVEPLAVSGAIRDTNGLYLVGVRNPTTVTQYKSHYEFSPSGGLKIKDVENGRVFPERGIKREFLDETYLKEEDLRSVRPLALLHNPQDHVFDIAYLLQLNRPFPNGRLLKEKDYVEQYLLLLEAAPDVLDVRGLVERGEKLVPNLPALYQLLKK